MTTRAKSNTTFELLPAPAPDKNPEQPELKAWSLVELFGHQRIVGWVTVDPIDFPGMIRVDVSLAISGGPRCTA